MTSDASPTEAFVWIWLPGQTTPVVCGRIRLRDGGHVFTYARSYLARREATPIYEPDLPLGSDDIEPLAPLALANSLRDAAPDAWGRRVIAYRRTLWRRQFLNDLAFEGLHEPLGDVLSALPDR